MRAQAHAAPASVAVQGPAPAHTEGRVEAAATPKPRYPEGGWGWTVVVGVAICNMTNSALVSVYGLLFGGTLESWGLETTGVAIISSTMSAVQSFSGLFSGSLMKYFGPKPVSLAGGLLVAGGMTLSFVATQPVHIFITWSILYGSGSGLLQPSTFLMVSSYFSKRRAQAVGLALAGTGLGQIMMPHVVRFLLKWYSFSGAVLVLGALALHSLPGCLLYRPPAPSRASCNRTEIEEDETQPLNEKAKVKASPLAGSNTGAKRVDPSSKSRRNLCKLVRSWDLDLLWSPRFLILTIGTGLMFTATTSFSMIFPFFLLDSVGLTMGATATCMSVQSGFDVLARLVLPLFIDRLHFRAKTVLLIGTVLAAASRSMMAEVTGFPEILSLSAISGFFRGATVLNQNLVVAEFVTPAKLPVALGLAMTVKGVCVLIVGSLLGLVRDATGSFPYFIHSLTGLVLVTGAVWLLEAVLCGCSSGTNR